MAAMIGAFFGKATDSSSIFENLKIAKSREKTLDPETEIVPKKEYNYRDFMNQYHVIYINFFRAANDSANYQEFITITKDTLQEDLREAFQDVHFRKKGTALQDLQSIFEQTGTSFILVLDEWDCIFHKTYTTEDDRRNFINWLAALTKDAAYVALTYMTGTLPIAKCSSGSTINNFDEYTMAKQPKFSEYFGFTEKEVDELYARYLRTEAFPAVTREDLRLWYDGYHTAGGERLYNPRSVVEALSNNCLASRRTTMGSYKEIGGSDEDGRTDSACGGRPQQKE